MRYGGFVFTRPKKWARHPVWVTVFIAIAGAAYLSINGWPALWYDWLPLAGATLSTVALSFQDVAVVKTIMLAAITSWLIYEAAHGL